MNMLLVLILWLKKAFALLFTSVALVDVPGVYAHSFVRERKRFI